VRVGDRPGGPRTGRRCLRATAAVGVLAAAGCGGATAASPRGGPVAVAVASTSCSTAATSASRRVVDACVFVLTDGRRYRCTGPSFSRPPAPTPPALERAGACVTLRRLAVPAAARAAVAAIASARSCLTAKGLRVTGGPVVAAEAQSPDGELVVGDGTGGAFVAFYGDPARAERLEPAVKRNARRFAGAVERRGAVTVLWIRPPAGGLRERVETCVFA
jgi:hypothetical protein